jgi:hypothetical protein
MEAPFNKRLALTALAWGAAAALGAMAYIALLQALDLNPFGRYKYLVVALYAFFFAGALLTYRKRPDGSYRLRMREGIFLGFLLNVAATAGFCFLAYLFLAHTEAGAAGFARYKQELQALIDLAEQLRPGEIPAQELQATRDNVRNMAPEALAIDQFYFFHGFGVLLSLATSFIFRHNPPKVTEKA